jgi:hypothetical protein
MVSAKECRFLSSESDWEQASDWRRLGKRSEFPYLLLTGMSANVHSHDLSLNRHLSTNQCVVPSLPRSFMFFVSAFPRWAVIL